MFINQRQVLRLVGDMGFSLRLWWIERSPIAHTLNLDFPSFPLLLLFRRSREDRNTRTQAPSITKGRINPSNKYLLPIFLGTRFVDHVDILLRVSEERESIPVGCDLVFISNINVFV